MARSSVSSMIRVDRHIDVNFQEPQKNGPWLFMLVHNCNVQESGAKMDKVVMSTSFNDGVDFAAKRYKVRVSQDGSIIYATSPYHPNFLMTNPAENFANCDSETISAHKSFATKLKRDECRREDRVECIAYHLPQGYNVTTQYFNNINGSNLGPPDLGTDGLYVAHVKFNTHTSWLLPPNHNNPIHVLRKGVPTSHNTLTIHLAITSTIVLVERPDVDGIHSAFQDAFYGLGGTY